jgi:hypothetical protein
MPPECAPAEGTEDDVPDGLELGPVGSGVEKMPPPPPPPPPLVVLLGPMIRVLFLSTLTKLAQAMRVLFAKCRTTLRFPK